MEANSQVDYIILNEDIEGNISLEELISEIKKINKNIKIIFTSNKSYNEDNLYNILKNNIEKENNKNIKKEINEKNNNYLNNKLKNNELNNLNKNNNEKIKINNNKIKNTEKNINKINYEKNKKIKPEIKEKISKKYNYKNKINNYNNFLETNNSEKINNYYLNKLKNNISENNNYFNNLNNKNIYKNKNIFQENNIEENLEKNNFNNKEKIFNKKTLPLNKLFNFNRVLKQNKKEVISILGPNGIGKSVFSILFAKTMEGKKSIIIDFDVLNESLHMIMGVKNYKEKIKRKIKNNDLIQNKNNLQKSILHTNLKIDLLPALNIILDPNYKLSYKKMNNIIDELKENYDLIIIDTSSETFLDYTREIINLSNKSIFISGANLLEVRKSERLLEIYKKDWNIEKGKISIVFNKCTKKSLDDTILREIFSNYDILGKIQLSDYYDLVINKNMTEENKLKKEIENIKKQIIKEKYYGVS